MRFTSTGMGLTGRLIELRRMLSRIHNFRLHLNPLVVIALSRRVAPVPRLIVPAALPEFAKPLAAFVHSAFAFAFVVVCTLCLLFL